MHENMIISLSGLNTKKALLGISLITNRVTNVPSLGFRSINAIPKHSINTTSIESRIVKKKVTNAKE